MWKVPTDLAEQIAQCSRASILAVWAEKSYAVAVIDGITRPGGRLHTGPIGFPGPEVFSADSGHARGAAATAGTLGQAGRETQGLAGDRRPFHRWANCGRDQLRPPWFAARAVEYTCDQLLPVREVISAADLHALSSGRRKGHPFPPIASGNWPSAERPSRHDILGGCFLRADLLLQNSADSPQELVCQGPCGQHAQFLPERLHDLFN